MISFAIILSGLQAASGHSEVMFWGSIGFVAVLFLGFALLWFRRKYHPENVSSDVPSMSFSMRSIEQMRDAGQISEDEFRRLRASSLGLASSNTDNDNSASSEPVDVDDEPAEADQDDQQQEDNKESI